jgi:hypothetical protein
MLDVKVDETEPTDLCEQVAVRSDARSPRAA